MNGYFVLININYEQMNGCTEFMNKRAND